MTKRQKGTILCVEDEADLLRDLADELEDAGYEVMKAGNGMVALDKIVQQKPDLIICDMMMPRLDGPGLLETLRKDHPDFNTVPFIFLTAKATREDRIAGKRMGVDDYLTKPVDFDLLLATVDQSLAQMRRIEEENRKTIRHIYGMVQEKRAAPGPLHIAFVTNKPEDMEPIVNALTETGCVAWTDSDEGLEKPNFALSRPADVVFLMHSKPALKYLRRLREGAEAHWSGMTVLLAPKDLTKMQLGALGRLGVDDYVEYPYRPMEMFRLLMRKMQAAA